MKTWKLAVNIQMWRGYVSAVRLGACSTWSTTAFFMLLVHWCEFRRTRGGWRASQRGWKTAYQQGNEWRLCGIARLECFTDREASLNWFLYMYTSELWTYSECVHQSSIFGSHCCVRSSPGTSSAKMVDLKFPLHTSGFESESSRLNSRGPQLPQFCTRFQNLAKISMISGPWITLNTHELSMNIIKIGKISDLISAWGVRDFTELQAPRLNYIPYWPLVHVLPLYYVTVPNNRRRSLKRMLHGQGFGSWTPRKLPFSSLPW